MVLPENSFAELMILLSFGFGELLLCFSNLSDSIIINSFSKSLTLQYYVEKMEQIDSIFFRQDNFQLHY